MKRNQFPWKAGAAIALVVVGGLSWDFWRGWSAKSEIHEKVRKAAADSALYLPYRPMEAVHAGMRALETMNITPDPGSVTVSPDGYQLKVSVISDVKTHFLWLLGLTKISFTAESEATIEFENSSPCDQLPLKEVALALVAPEAAFRKGELEIYPSGAEGSVIRAYEPGGAAEVKVGDFIICKKLLNLEKFASRQRIVVIILQEIAEEKGVVRGFAAVDINGLKDGGILSGKIIQLQAEGEPERVLPAVHDFGLRRGGMPKVRVS